MKSFSRYLSVFAPIVCVIGLSACSGGDTEDRLDVADPSVRFVHASPLAPSVTLFRNDVAQPNATEVSYKFASDYVDVGSDIAKWSVKTAQANILVGDVSVDAQRGNRYTIVVLPSSNTENSLYVIRDPYNKSLISNNAKLRVVNASFNATNIDVYLNPPNTDISGAGVAPVIAATAYKTAGPATGTDSLNIDNGTYQMAMTSAGTKKILFKGIVTIDRNKDILVLAVPSSILPGDIKALVKVEGVAGTTELPAS